MTHTRPDNQSLRLACSQVELLEPLEPRRLLATIEGSIWNDVDNDGLRDFFEDPRPGVTVYLDENRNGLFEAPDPETGEGGEPSAVTDEDGNYRFEDVPVAPGVEDDPDTEDVDESEQGGSNYFIGQLLTGGSLGEGVRLGQTAPGVSGRSTTRGAFNIELNYLDSNLGPEQRLIVETAVSKWEQVIIGDLPNIAGVDDLLVDVTAAFVDGPSGTLAFARPSQVRPAVDDEAQVVSPFGESSGLPYRGETTVDTSDAAPVRLFSEVVIHEVGHILGIGSLWYDDLIARGTLGVAHIGENSVREYNRIYDLDVSSVPVQPFVEGHWSEDALGDELMTPGAGDSPNALGPPDGEPANPLSRLSIAALQDLGYEVNYAAAEPFGPFNIGPLPEDLVNSTDEGDDTEIERALPFQIGVFLADDDAVIDDANFGVRDNTAPEPFFFQAGPAVQQQGQDVRLLATIDTSTDADFTGDVDLRDGVVQVNFYRESNGAEGLQTGPGGDELLQQDADGSDGYDFDASTDGLPLGEQIFYARAYDEAYFTRDRALIVTVVDGQDLPERPTGLQAVGVSPATILVSFQDNSESESGFFLEVSGDPTFEDADQTRRIVLPAGNRTGDELADRDAEGEIGEGTGLVTFEVDIARGEPGSEVTSRSFRVRAFNTAGVSGFSDVADARTLSLGETLVDNDAGDERGDPGEVEADDGVERLFDGSAVGGTYLRLDDGEAALFRPRLGQDGEFLVFFRGFDDEDADGTATVEVVGSGGDVLGSEEVDLSESGSGEVLLGRFSLGDGAFVRVRADDDQAAAADAVRFLPTGGQN